MKFAAVSLMCFVALAYVHALSPQSSPSKSPTEIAASLDSKLDKRIDNFETAGRTLMDIAVGLAYEYQFPLAIEFVDREGTTRSINLEFHNESVRDILGRVVSEFPEYRVEFSPQVVQIYSPQARQDPSNQLNKAIKDFSVVDADTGDAGLELACSLSRELRIATFCGGSVAGGQWGSTKLTLHLQDAKVYEILNAIIAQNGSALWAVTVSPEGLRTATVANLWHIFPLDAPFKRNVLDRLMLASAEGSKTP
jgi:hypothetical protein